MWIRGHWQVWRWQRWHDDNDDDDDEQEKQIKCGWIEHRALPLVIYFKMIYDWYLRVCLDVLE